MKLAIRVTPLSSRFFATGEIRDVTPGEVMVVLDRLVPVGSSVAVEFKNASFEGEVMCCQPKDSQYQANVRIKDTDESGLRRSPRFTVNIPAQILTQDCTDPLWGTILDISGNGLGLELGSPLPVGETIAVESEMNIAFGVVTHSRRYSESAFRGGVALYQRTYARDLNRFNLLNEGAHLGTLKILG